MFRHSDQKPSSSKRGFTLVETMVSAVVLGMVALGTITVVIKAYELTAEARLRDNARSVLRTFGDQFMRLQTNDPTTNQTRRFFNHTYNTGATSDGLVWGALCDGVGGVGAVVPLVIDLRGSDDTTAKATVTREVKFIRSDTGVAATTATRDLQAPGYFISGTFYVTFKFKGKNISESMTFLRLVP